MPDGVLQRPPPALAPVPPRRARSRPPVAATTRPPAPVPAAVPVAAAGPALRLRTQAPGAPEGVPGAVAQVARAPGAGAPLPGDVREVLSRRLRVDLGPVRVHTDEASALAADALGARAFTYGTHIFLGEGESATDLGLMAHEVAHVVQQQAAPAVRLFQPASSDPLEREAEGTAAAVQGGERATVAGRTTRPGVQRAPDLGDLIANRVWGLLERHAPELVPILRQGVFEWLQERIGEAMHRVFDSLMAPVRAVTGVVGELSSHVRSLVEWMRDAAQRIVGGDCSALQEAADRIQRVIDGIASPVLERLKAVAQRIRNFFSGLWERYGAPVWDFLRRLGGAVWDRVQRLGRWIWEKTQPIRDFAPRAWRWFKNQVGIGEGPEGQNGLLQWVQQKASQAWDWLKTRLEPFKRPLLVAGGVLAMLSPAGPLIAMGTAVYGVIRAVRWIRAHMTAPGGVVGQREALQQSIIPGLLGAVRALSSALERGAQAVTDRLRRVAGGLGEAVGALGRTFLRVAVGLLEWILKQVQALVQWATDLLMVLARWVTVGLDRLAAVFRPVLEFLRRIGEVVGNLLRIGSLVLSRLWHAIPACIRDPFVNFLTNHILRRIPLFAQLLAIPNIWSRIRETAMRAVQQVFRDGNLAGAAMTVFRFLLEVLRVPVQLVQGIFRKASAALDLILRDPVGFLRKIIGALRRGFARFGSAIGSHLLAGVMNWLFAQARQAGVVLPSELNVGTIFRLVLQVLGITFERVIDTLARKVGRPLAERIRGAAGALTGAFEWMATLVREGPAGLWRHLREYLSDLWETVRDAAIGWLRTTVIGPALAKFAAFLVPGANIVNGIISLYQAIESAVEYLTRILEIVDRWLDTLAAIARGAVEASAERLERLFASALPIAIGFLANQVPGLRNLSRRIREMIERVQARVMAAIERLVERAMQVGRRMLEVIFGQRAAPATPAPATDQREFIYTKTIAGHTIRVRRDLTILRFSTPTVLTGEAKQAAEQTALADIVKPQAPRYPTDGLGRPRGPSGHVTGVKEGQQREELKGSGKGYLPGDHRGHLIGDRFYGSPAHENLVPMHYLLNTSTFATFEHACANRYLRLRNELKRGVLLCMHVVPRYLPGDDPDDHAHFRPTRVRGIAKLITLKAGSSSLEAQEEVPPIDSGDLENPLPNIPIFKINADSETVLRSVGLSKRLVKAIIAQRAREPFPGRSTPTGQEWEDTATRLIEALGDYAYLVAELERVRTKISYSRTP